MAAVQLEGRVHLRSCFKGQEAPPKIKTQKKVDLRRQRGCAGNDDKKEVKAIPSSVASTRDRKIWNTLVTPRSTNFRPNAGPMVVQVRLIIYLYAFNVLIYTLSCIISYQVPFNTCYI